MRNAKTAALATIAARAGVALGRCPASEAEPMARVADDATRLAVAAFAARQAANAGKDLAIAHVETIVAIAEKYGASAETPLDPNGMAAGLRFSGGERSGFRDIVFLS